MAQKACFQVFADSNVQKLKRTPFAKIHAQRLVKTVENPKSIRTPFSENKIKFTNEKNNDFLNKSNLKATSSIQFENIKKVNTKLNFRDNFKPETPKSQFDIDEFLWEVEDDNEIDEWYNAIKKRDTKIFESQNEILPDLLSCTFEEPPPLIDPDTPAPEMEYSSFPADFI